MTIEPERLESLISRIHEQEPDVGGQQEAIETLRRHAFDAAEVTRILSFAEDPDAPVALRRSAIQVLGFHRPWLRFELLHEAPIQNIPTRLAALVTDSGEDRSVRETIITALGRQYLSEHHVWDTLLADSDPFLRREALYEMLRIDDRKTVEQIIIHMTTESEPSVRNGILWGLARHPHFIDTALSMTARTGGAFYLETIHKICETDPPGATRALLAADIKHFDAREALIQRLYRKLDPPRIAYLVDSMKEGSHPFAIRLLREADADVVGDIISQLSRTIQQDNDEDWVEEASKLALHYWDRFESMRETIREMLSGWRHYSPKVTHLAMGRDIFWKD